MSDDRYDAVLAESSYDEARREWTHNCEAILMATNVAMSVWYRRGPGLCAGTGEVRNVTVPYCPTCETKPRSTGVIYAD